MTAHLIAKEMYDALGQDNTLVRIVSSGQYVTVDKDSLIVYWPQDIDEDYGIGLPDPSDCHFNVRVYFVNDSGVDQSFEAAGETYTVPAGTDMEVRISIRDGAKAYVATYYFTPT